VPILLDLFRVSNAILEMKYRIHFETQELFIHALLRTL